MKVNAQDIARMIARENAEVERIAMRIPRRVTAEYEDGMARGYGMSIRRLVPYWGIGGRLNIWAWQFVAFTFEGEE